MSWGSRLAVVDQHDAVIATSTPRTILEFTSALRLSDTMKEEDRTQIILDLMDQLGNNCLHHTFLFFCFLFFLRFRFFGKLDI